MTMATSKKFSITKLLGEELISPGSDIADYDTNNLQNKTIALCICVSWYTNEMAFAEELANTYKQLDDDIKTKFDVILVCYDESKNGFDICRQRLPWLAIPYDEDFRRKYLNDKYKDKRLVIFKPDGQLITEDGQNDYLTAKKCIPDGNFKYIEKWIEGKTFCWTRTPKDINDHLWVNTICVKCFMAPIVGERYTIPGNEYKYDNNDCGLCHSCFEMLNDHDKEQTIRRFVPGGHYSIKELVGYDELLVNHNGDRISFDKFINGKRVVGLCYFHSKDSAIRRRLIDVYNQMVESTANDSSLFDIIHVPNKYQEKNGTIIDDYDGIPWKAIPYSDSDMDLAKKHNLKMYMSDHPTYCHDERLVILKSDGEILTDDGFTLIENRGLEAIQMWIKHEHPEHIWSDEKCSECGIEPIVGAKYYCIPCYSYKLCKRCWKQGHKHDLYKHYSPPQYFQSSRLD